jgi:hypothetical protein
MDYARSRNYDVRVPQNLLKGVTSDMKPSRVRFRAETAVALFAGVLGILTRSGMTGFRL